jgi:hypothetical protein
MQKLEKRNFPRQTLQIPLRFRLSEPDAEFPELVSETSNISRSGLFMTCGVQLKLGLPISMTLRIPTYLTGCSGAELNCHGRVIHERRLPNGDIGYGV